MTRFIPILEWLPHYKSAWLAPDLIAGLSVWAIVVPQSIAYASIVGVPAQYGLYTAIGAALMYAVFASTRQVFAGPSATVAAVAYAVATLVVAANSPQYLTVVVGLTFATALIYLLLGVFRMGWFANFLASGVLEGFIFAFGFGLIADQLHKIMGVPKVEGSYWQILVGTLKEWPQINWYTMAVGCSGIAALVLMRYFAPRLPRAIIVVITGIVATSALGLSQFGVAVVGDLPAGLPSLTLPTGLTLSQWSTLTVGAIAVILVGFSESIAAATKMAGKYHREVSANQELIAQGGATLGAAVLGGFPVDGSLSKSSVADNSGQKSQMGSLVVAFLTVITVLFLTGLFANLPKAILGAVVIDAAIGLIDFKVPARYAAVSRRDFTIFAAAAVGLFFIGVVAGVILGVIVSLLLLISAASKSPVRRLAYDETDDVWVDASSNHSAKQYPGVLVVAIDGPLFFADAGQFRTVIKRMVVDEGSKRVVVDLGSMADIDLDGADMLGKVASEVADLGGTLLLARLDSSKVDLLQRAGTLDAIGEHNVYVTVRAAVESAAAAQPQ